MRNPSVRSIALALVLTAAAAGMGGTMRGKPTQDKNRENDGGAVEKGRGRRQGRPAPDRHRMP